MEYAAGKIDVKGCKYMYAIQIPMAVFFCPNDCPPAMVSPYFLPMNFPKPNFCISAWSYV